MEVVDGGNIASDHLNPVKGNFVARPFLGHWHGIGLHGRLSAGGWVCFLRTRQT